MDSKFTAFQKAKELAPFLKGFTVNTAREVGDHYAELVSGDEVIGLYVVTYGSQAGRIEVSGGYPAGPDNENLSGNLYDIVDGRSVHVIPPRIGINGNRPAPKIAADIERRFLPEYRNVLAKVKAKKAEFEKYKNAVLQNTNELFAICGGRMNRDYNSFSLPFNSGNAYGDVQVSSSSADIKLSSVPIPLAKEILSLIAKADKAAKGRS